MDALQVIAPLVGVVIGSFTSGITANLKARAERKRIIAVALADLLEVRHRILAIDLVLAKVSSIVNLEPKAIPFLRNLMDTVAPLDPKLDERYSNAVSLLAGIDPVLAFNLRSKNDLPKVLSSLRGMAADEGGDPVIFESFESTLRAASTPSLSTAVKELARAHSIRMSWRVNKLIHSSQSLPPDVEAFLNNIGAQAQIESTHVHTES